MKVKISILPNNSRILFTSANRDEDGTVYHYHDGCSPGEKKFGMTFEQLLQLGSGWREYMELIELGKQLSAGSPGHTPQATFQEQSA